MSLKKHRTTRADVEILDKETTYQGFFKMVRFQLKHRLFNGGWSTIFDRELLERGNSVGILPYDPQLDKVILIEQFRVGVITHETAKPWMLEIVAGMIKEGETAAEVAERELLEEAGLTLKKLSPLYEYWVSPGGSSERMTLFLGEVDASHAGGIHGLPEEHEDIYVHVLSVEDALNALHEGKIRDAMTIIALQWLELTRVC
jgi:ADP-ribose pyrophosphatase